MSNSEADSDTTLSQSQSQQGTSSVGQRPNTSSTPQPIRPYIDNGSSLAVLALPAPRLAELGTVSRRFRFLDSFFTANGVSNIAARPATALREASMESIEGLPKVAVSEEGMVCSICRIGFKVGDEAKEMPCGHRFHEPCIDTWLGRRASCPLCRFRMPEQEDDGHYDDDDADDDEHRDEDDE